MKILDISALFHNGTRHQGDGYCGNGHLVDSHCTYGPYGDGCCGDGHYGDGEYGDSLVTTVIWATVKVANFTRFKKGTMLILKSPPTIFSTLEHEIVTNY